MNKKLEAVQIAVAKGIPENILKELMIQYLVDDMGILPTMMKILQVEREEREELKQDMNLNLTRNTMYIKDPKVRGNPNEEEYKQFLLKETKECYKKHQHQIKTAGIHIWDDLP